MTEELDQLDLNNQAANIYNWINYDPLIGVEGLHITGIPRYGKSNMASGLALQCLKQGERLIMPGDRFCEWRHFPTHKTFKKNNWKIKVIIPEGIRINYYPEDLKDKAWFDSINYDQLDILDHLDHNVIVIYDQHLWPIGRRTWLWARVLDQLLSRTIYIDRAMFLLFHEAGIYFPEGAESSGTIDDNLYQAIRTFAELYVEAGKGLVRCCFLSQLETELKYTIREKTGWKVFRKGHPGRKQHRLIKKVAPYQARNEFISSCYGLFLADNTNKKFIENKSKWLMIPPPRLIDRDDSPPIPPQKKRQMICEKCGHTWKPRKKEPKSCPRCKDYGILEVEA